MREKKEAKEQAKEEKRQLTPVFEKIWLRKLGVFLPAHKTILETKPNKMHMKLKFPRSKHREYCTKTRNSGEYHQNCFYANGDMSQNFTQKP